MEKRNILILEVLTQPVSRIGNGGYVMENIRKFDDDDSDDDWNFDEEE